MLRICAESDVPVFFEPTDPRKGAKALKSPWIQAIKYTSPNMHELCNMVGEEINQSEEPANLINDCDALGRILMRQMPGTAAIIVTLGEHGVLLIEPGAAGETEDSETEIQSRHYAVKSEPNILSVSGAGDCLSAGFITGILTGCNHHQAILMGLKAARLSLLSMDTVPETLSLQNITVE